MTAGVEAELERLRSGPVGVRTEVGFFQPPVKVADGPTFAAQYDEIFVAESYDFPASNSKPTIVDCGANVGLGVLWWRARWPECRIIAFEPDPEIFELLAWNARYLVGVELLQKAVTATGERVTFFAQGTDAGRIGHPETLGAGAKAIQVESVRVSSVLSGLDQVALLKLDIEGAELDVLNEAFAELSRVERLIVEFHSFEGSQQRLGELLQLLRRAGYRYYLQTPIKTFRPFRGVSVNQGIDLQCDIFAWR